MKDNLFYYLAVLVILLFFAFIAKQEADWIDGAQAKAVRVVEDVGTGQRVFIPENVENLGK